MSIKNINFDLAKTTNESSERLIEPGSYGVIIEDALSKPNKALSGTNLAVYFRVVKVFEGAGKVGETFSAYYAYEHPNPRAVSLAIGRIKELLEVCGLPAGSDENALVGKTLAAKMQVDKSGSLTIAAVKPFKTTVEKQSTVATFSSNPFEQLF